MDSIKSAVLAVLLTFSFIFSGCVPTRIRIEVGLEVARDSKSRPIALYYPVLDVEYDPHPQKGQAKLRHISAADLSREKQIESFNREIRRVKTCSPNEEDCYITVNINGEPVDVRWDGIGFRRTKVPDYIKRKNAQKARRRQMPGGWAF